MSAKKTDHAKSGTTPAKRRIGELLLDDGLITGGQLDEALAMQGKNGGKIVENLIRLGYLDTKTFVDFLARQPGTPSIGLTNYTVPKEILDLVPREFAIANELFPIDRMGKLLTVGMACPLDSATIHELEEHTGLRVKALLCPPDDIREAIRHYYPAENREMASYEPDEIFTTVSAAMRVESIASLVRALDGLPALPDTVAQVREAMDNPEVSMETVADTVSRDPAISAGLLRLANSAAYGFAHRVDSVQMATKLLGLREMYMIVMSAAVIDLFKQSKFFDYAAFWRRSTACGAAVRAIAKARGISKPSSAFTAGLLADIGQLAMAEVAPDQYAEVDGKLDGLDLVAEEERILGLSHTEAGFELSRTWSLPMELQEAIRFQHRLDLATEDPELAAAVGVGVAMARALVDQRIEDPMALATCGDGIALLKLTPEQTTAILQEISQSE